MRESEENFATREQTGKLGNSKFRNVGMVSLALAVGGVLAGCQEKDISTPENHSNIPVSPVEAIAPFNSPKELELIEIKATEMAPLIREKQDPEEAMGRLENIDTLIRGIIKEVNEEDGVEVPITLLQGILFTESEVRGDAISPDAGHIGLGQISAAIAEQNNLRVDQNFAKKFLHENKVGRREILADWRIADERFDKRKNIYATVKELSRLSKLYHGDWQLAIWAYHAGEGNAHSILTEYIEAKTGLKFGGGKKIYDFVRQHRISYGSLMEAYLGSDQKFDGVREFFDSQGDESRDYYFRVLSAASTADRYFNHKAEFAKERAHFRSDEIQSVAQRIILDKEAEKFAKEHFIEGKEFKNSGDIESAIFRGEMVKPPVWAPSLGYTIRTDLIGEALEAQNVGGEEQRREVKDRFLHTRKETYGLILEIAQKFQAISPEAPPLVITKLSSTLAYERMTSKSQIKKPLNSCTGYSFVIGVNESFDNPETRRDWLKRLSGILWETQFINKEVIFRVFKKSIQVDLGSKSADKYLHYFNENNPEKSGKLEHQRGNFKLPFLFSKSSRRAG